MGAETEPGYLAPRDIRVDVRVTRVYSNVDNPRPIRLTVTDKTSGAEFLEVRFTREEWADVLTGSSTYDPGAEAETRVLHRVGLVQQIAHEVFDGRESKDFGEARAQAWCDEMLANGWHIKSARRNNAGQTVAWVRRYVEADAAPAEATP